MLKLIRKFGITIERESNDEYGLVSYWSRKEAYLISLLNNRVYGKFRIYYDTPGKITIIVEVPCIAKKEIWFYETIGMKEIIN